MVKVGNWLLSIDEDEAWDLQTGFGLRVVLWPKVSEGGFALALTHVGMRKGELLSLLDRAESYDEAKAKLRAAVEQLSQRDVLGDRVTDYLITLAQRFLRESGINPEEGDVLP